jgi:hypothetical protein
MMPTKAARLIADLEELHTKEFFESDEFESDGSCKECADYWPCPTITVVRKYKRAMTNTGAAAMTNTDAVTRLENWCDKEQRWLNETDPGIGLKTSQHQQRVLVVHAYLLILGNFRRLKHEYRTVKDQELRNIKGWCANEVLAVIALLANAHNHPKEDPGKLT